MTKAPLAGRVKTRLTPPLTPIEAAALNGCFLQDIATALTNAGTRTQGVGCYTPRGTEKMYQDLLPQSFLLLAQRDKSFGERLRFAVEDLLSVGFNSVCLISSDSPIVGTATYAEAARLLSRPNDSVVLGPSDDGGYYLIGLKKLHLRLFEEIEWSTERVLDQTLARAEEMRLPVHFLPSSFDVDDQDGLSRLCSELLVVEQSEAGDSGAATKAFLADLIAREGRGRIWPEEGSPSVSL
jgi:rSAM/selenodomain-associated transferase 1